MRYVMIVTDTKAKTSTHYTFINPLAMFKHGEKEKAKGNKVKYYKQIHKEEINL